MRAPTQRDPAAFLPDFFGCLFDPADPIVLTHLWHDGVKMRVENNPMLFEDAIEWGVQQVVNKQGNLYFRASTLDGSNDYGKQNCLRTRALYIDVDFGKKGHKDTHPPFQTGDDALGYLLTMPIQPSILWHTGHGFQGAYLLDRPYVFPKGGGRDDVERYCEVAKLLSKMAMADSAYTPEHLFRVPLSLNDKRYLDPKLPVVAGTVIWFEPRRLHTIEDIEAALSTYGADAFMAGDKDSEVPSLPELDDAGIGCPYAELPESLRHAIETYRGERSDEMFRLVAQMIAAGYNDETIRDAIGHGPAFQTYGRDLDRHISRCLDKARNKRYVYPSKLATPITVNNAPVDRPLHGCDPLPPELDAMLVKYEQVTSGLHEGVRMAARFHEHMFREGSTGVLESPCGSGKSTWALCHIALNASPEARYLFVVETVVSLYRAADTLEQLTDTPVGRVHGFDTDKCRDLCGSTHDWRECRGTARGSVCNECTAAADCMFFTRARQERNPILCLTHNGFIRLLEEDSPLLDGARIIVDEDLSPFNAVEFSMDDLDNLAQFDTSIKRQVGRYFPGSRLSHAGELAKWNIPAGADTFASRNYCFRNADQTAALAGAYGALRGIRIEYRSTANAFNPGNEDKARDTLAALLNALRPVGQGDSTYAFKENNKGEVSYSLIRSRFSLETDRPYDKLWILNASAQLSPDRYPESFGVYACPDLPDSSHLLTVHAAKLNPTKERRLNGIQLADCILRHAEGIRGRHRQIMVASNKDMKGLDIAEGQLKRLFGCNDQDIVRFTRGRIKGSNTAGDCTLAYLASMSLFTTLNHLALLAALHIRRTFPDRPYIFTSTGDPNWNAGMPSFMVLRNLYALRALDELYQTMWRTCIRNNRPAHVIIAVPQADWLVTLWRTVAPRFRMGTAVEAITECPYDAQYMESVDNSPHMLALKVQPEEGDFYWRSDGEMAGLEVINMPPGTKIRKQDAAYRFGYTGERAWERHADNLRRWLEPFFDIGHHALVRRPYNGVRLCNAGDKGSICTIINAAPADSVPLSGPDVAELIAANTEFWGVEADGTLRTVAGLRHMGGFTVISHFSTDPGWQRQGLGSRLWRYLKDLALYPAVVRVPEGSDAAARFFEANGFLPATEEQEQLQAVNTSQDGHAGPAALLVHDCR